MASEHYREFIKEAFIQPIRSVLIVDDDYPTYDDILRSQTNGEKNGNPNNQKAWHKKPDRIKRVIDNFRIQNPPLLVDVHDGTNIGTESEADSVKHLHQCDLLVLDYQLDKSKELDGGRAIEILRGLMANNHFNLVVVYTQKDIDETFTEVLLGLMNPSTDFLSSDEIDRAKELIEKGEDETQFLNWRLSNSVAVGQYLHFRRHTNLDLESTEPNQSSYWESYMQATPASWSPEERQLVLRYLLMEVEQQHIGNRDMIPTAKHLEWSIDSINWIKSDSIFVTFSAKSDAGDDLLSELLSALSDWCPNPSRLLLSKLRATMDEHGTVAQAQALTNKHALAHWYKRLLYADEPVQRWHVAESVSRHSEQLMDMIFPSVKDFATRLINAEANGNNGDNADQICHKHFKVDLADSGNKTTAALEHNAYVCSKDPEGWHLTTGQIFLMRGGYWLCLSPACDMVPHRSEWRTSTFGKYLPFIAVKLQPLEIKNDKLPSDVHTNRYLFLRIDDDVKGFCFNTRSGEDSAPHFHTLYAEEQGKFNGEGFRFSVLQAEPSQTEPGETTFSLNRYEAEVVGQLRYEYALNLMQKLGVFLTRIGLDFSDGKSQA